MKMTSIREQNAEMAALAKATLRANPMMGVTAKCNRGLGPNELTLTVITLANGQIVKCWNEANGLQIRGVGRKNRQEISKVEYVVADRSTKQPLRVKATFNLIGNDLVSA